MTTFVAKQLARLREQLQPAPAEYVRPVETWWHFFSRHPLPLAGMVDWKRLYARFCLYLGLNIETQEFVFTEPESAVLVIGRSGSLKTAGLMIQNALLAVGPLLCISPRLDLFRNTSRWRSQFGTVYHFSPTGKRLAGATPVRFSPLQGCEDEEYADRCALRWASWIDRSEYAQQGGAKSFPYFRERCHELLFALFFIAATLDRDIGWVYRVVASSAFTNEIKELRNATAKHPELSGHVDALVKFALLAAEERGSVLGTTSNALGAYRNAQVVRADNDPDVTELNFRAFVRGRPDQRLDLYGIDTTILGDHGVWPFMTGAYDSLYMTEVSAESPESFICMDIEFRVREAMFEYAEERERAGLGRPMPLTIVNDEAYVAPPVQLGALAAVQRGRGINFIMALQSLSQAETIWGRLGQDFLTLFPTAVIFPGIKDEKTLRLLSMLAGQYWQEMPSQTSSTDGRGGASSGTAVNWQLMDRLPPWLIAQGHPDVPDAAILLRPDASWDWVEVKPYYRDEPWPRLLVNATEHTLATESALPGPLLAREGDFSHLNPLGLGMRFQAILDRLSQY